MTEQQARELTETERDFQESLVQAVSLMAELPTKARAVAAEGGDCRQLFLDAIEDENDRAVADTQWAMLSMILGV